MARIKRAKTGWESINDSLLDILNDVKYTNSNKAGVRMTYYGKIEHLRKSAMRIVNACERLEEENDREND